MPSFIQRMGAALTAWKNLAFKNAGSVFLWLFFLGARFWFFMIGLTFVGYGANLLHPAAGWILVGLILIWDSSKEESQNPAQPKPQPPQVVRRQ